MVLYSFTNRRRAKDSVMQIRDEYPDNTDCTTVFIQKGVIYIEIDENTVTDVATIMHFGTLVTNRLLTNVFNICDATEVYHGDGLVHFRA